MDYAYSLLGRRPRPGHEVFPVWKRPGPSSQLGCMRAYGTAATCGIIITLIFSYPSPHSFRLTRPQPQCSTLRVGTNPASTLVSEGYIRTGLGQYVAPDEDRWYLESLSLCDMVSRTQGYFARDYSVWLGWNNMRYIIETAALHAKLLNRTLVIPSYIDARSCEWEIEVCATYAIMAARRKTMSNAEWNALPPNKRVSWKIPIQVMLDIDAFRKHVPVVTVAEYLQLHGLPETLETDDGHWDLEAYHFNCSITPPSLAVIPNYDYDRDLHGIARVDRLPGQLIEAPHKGSPEWKVYRGLLGLLGRQITLDAEVARSFLRQHTDEDWQSASEMGEIASKYGFAVVYTYNGQPSVHGKTVNNPAAELVPAATMRGFIDDYSHYTEDVLLLQGEIHSDRKPGSMTFTSEAARDNYTDIVLRGINHLPSIRFIADAVAAHMRELNNGRMWMAAHWRRSDFVVLHWNQGTPTEEIDHILMRFRKGTELLYTLRDEEGFRPPSAPNAKLDQSFENASLPLLGDRWYLATDERDPEALAVARAKNATLFYDVIESTPGLRRFLGWPMLFTDVLALVEQEIMARSAFFSGYAHTSVAGGVANLRTVRGMDPRTMVLDDLS